MTILLFSDQVHADLYKVKYDNFALFRSAACWPLKIGFCNKNNFDKNFNTERVCKLSFFYNDSLHEFRETICMFYKLFVAVRINSVNVGKPSDMKL